MTKPIFFSFGLLISFFLIRKSKGQQQKVGDNSTGIQAGRDVKIKKFNNKLREFKFLSIQAIFSFFSTQKTPRIQKARNNFEFARSSTLYHYPLYDYT